MRSGPVSYDGQALEALRESEEKFRVLAELSLAMIWLYQGENFIYVNRAAEQMTGYSVDELLKMKFWEVVHPDDRGLVRQRGLARQRGETVPLRYEVKLLTKDGVTKWTELSAGRIEYRGRPAGIATFFDITERKRVEASLRENDAYLSRAQKIAHLGSWVWDIKTGRQRWSDESYRIFGFAPGEVEPDHELFVSLLHPGDRERVSAASADLLERGVPYNVDYRVVRRDGSVRYIHAEGEVSLDDAGGQSLVFGINQDITEHRLAEDELIEAKAMAELYLDLMGHDINNMHQIALGYLEMARDLQVSEIQKEFIDRPIEVLQRSARLIRNVRKLQKLRDGAFRDEPIDLYAVLSAVQREYGSLPDKAISMDLGGKGPCFVLANELLYDVFANLVSNAIKHTGSHASVTISLKNAFADGRRQYMVSVEDDGPGIPDDFKRLIFNRMLKGTSKAKGMGLGLYLVRTLVESYGGKVWAEDRVPGDYTKGARFVVIMPAIEQ